MFIALGLLLGLVSLCPAILIVDGPILPCLIPLLTGLGLILVAVKLPPGDTQRWAKLIRPFVIGAAVPAAWMALQMLPLPSWRAEPWARLSDLAHPVWASVAAGFPQGVAGSISVDIGATAVALVRYLSIVGVILLASAITISRDRAESALVSLTAATVLIAFVVIYADISGSNLVAAREEALDCASLGLVLSAACASLVFERHETRGSKVFLRDTEFLYAALACVTAFVICAIAVGAARSGSLIFAATCGFGVYCAVVIVRRLDLGRWGAGAIAVTASVIALAFVTGAGSNADPRLAFVKKDAAAVEMTQRMLADAPFLGDGAGAFGALLPIYQSTVPSAGEFEAVTAAAKLSIEMGRPVLWAAVLAAAIATLSLLRAAARRGRDSFYSAAGAACLVMLVILIFVNGGIFGSAIAVLAGVILGLAVAQSQGRVAS